MSKVKWRTNPLNSSRCEGLEEDENTILYLHHRVAVDNLLKTTFWKIPEENVSNDDVDKWALASWSTCSFESFGGANPPLSTLIGNRSNGSCGAPFKEQTKRSDSLPISTAFNCNLL